MMMKLSQKVINFLKEQEFLTFATLDPEGKIHISIKGLVNVSPDGKLYILDLYHGRTYRNLKRNPWATVSAVDAHLFQGYALQGEAEIVDIENVGEDISRKWEKNIAKRVSRRLLRNVKKGVSSTKHPEANFPRPKYLILFKVKKVIDLAPQRNF